MDSGIYQIRHIESGKVYVGSAKSFKKRWREHRRLLRSGKHPNRHILASWQKYGEEGFVFEVIEVVTDVQDLVMREQHWIDAKQACGKAGYNLSPTAGSTLGVIVSPERRAKIGAANRNPSPETREKMRAANQKRPPEFLARLIEMNRNPSPERIAKMRAAKLNPSAETRAKISAAASNPSPETRAKISAAARNLSPETRAKMSQSQRGRVASPETRAKMSDSQKRRVLSSERRIRIGEINRQRAAMYRLARDTHQPSLPFPD
jgi:group I intron endonuclease